MPRSPKKSHIPDFGALRRTIEATADAALLAEVEAYANDERDNFVAKVERQAFASFQVILYPESGTNLSPQWLARKEAKGADMRTMIATHWYKDHVRVDRRKARRKGEKTVFKIGFRPDVKPRDLDGNVVDVEIPALGLRGLDAIAMVQEKGSVAAGIPARPHWRPHYDKMRLDAPRVRKRIRERVKQAIKRQVGRKVVVR